jgi:hypothetical protein
VEIMSRQSVPGDQEAHIRDAFERESIPVRAVTTREFPSETIFIVEVLAEFERAVQVASRLDSEIEGGFVTVRLAADVGAGPSLASAGSVHDERVTDLVELLNARSRTSEVQPSLHYVEDAGQRLKVATAPRNHLIFGRRGVGKTALMLEAKDTVLKRGAATVWVNVQTIRSQDSGRAFLSVASEICDMPRAHFKGRASKPESVQVAAETKARIQSAIDAGRIGAKDIAPIITSVRQLLKLFCAEIDGHTYLFLDDFHYLRVNHVPLFLDHVHAVTRDIAVWIKAAAVRHQTRWFTASPATGLQSGHDAAIINLDITLEDPGRARRFLTSVLSEYVTRVGIKGSGGVLSAQALDRLVLASGGVPRDFLTLCAASLEVARERAKARQAGVQDVNNAAGRAAGAKLEELERDAAAALGSAEAVLRTIADVREFLLKDKKCTFLRIEFRDKEKHPREYALVQSLMDLRLLHLLSAGVSARHEAGARSEAYMLDLSEYSGQRLKWNLSVLDLERDHLLLKRTRSTVPAQHGRTPRQLITILRGGPEYSLARLRRLSAGMAAVIG